MGASPRHHNDGQLGPTIVSLMNGIVLPRETQLAQDQNLILSLIFYYGFPGTYNVILIGFQFILI